MSTPEKLALAILRDIFARRLVGCRDYEELNEHVDANDLGDPGAHGPRRKGPDGVQARCDFLAKAQAIVKDVIGAAPVLELVTILHGDEIHVYAPPGFSADITHFNRDDLPSKSTDAAHAALIQADEHPDYRGFHRLD